MTGLRVIACHSKDGLYYSGHVGSTPEATYAMVNFSFKQRQKVRTQMIIPMSGAIPRPELQLGDYVLVKVFNGTKNLDCYVPAIIEFIPEDIRHSSKFYSVLMYNGQRATTMRKYIVKIGQSRFDMALKYISHLQQNSLKEEKHSSNQSQDLDRSYDDASSGRSSQRSSDRSSQRSTDRSSQRSSTKGRKKKEKLTKKLEKRPEVKQKTRSEKRKKSRSPSSSSRSSKSRSRSNSSRSQSRSRSRSRSKSRSPPRSRSRSSSRSHSRCLDGRALSDDSSTPRARQSPVERPSNPVPKPRPLEPMPRNDSLIDTNITRNDIYTSESLQGYSSPRASRVANVDEKEQMIGDLQYQLAKQTHKQLRQERRLIRQARKINKIQRKLKSSNQQQNDSLHSDKSRSQRSSDTDTTSPHRRKGSPDGTSYRDTPDLLSIRRSLPGLRVDQEVLARWSDDGWYYRGCISGEGNDQQYVVSDATGHLEAIWREDIMADVDHKYDAIQPRDYVIGLHPKYVFSYAPAEVLDTYANNSVKVEFYDGNIAKLTSEEVYKIPKAKYKKDVEYVKECEKRIVGKSVVARDNDTGAYRLGVVDDFVGLGQQYFIKWLDGMVCKQTSHHMFEVTQRQLMHESWEHVLAPVDQRNTRFMPAQVVRSEPLKVQFCDGNSSSDVQLDQCFWLSKDYYRNAVEYLHSRNEVLHTRQKVY